MNLKNKKKLIARVLGIGTGRIRINSIEEIKEAITRQDIKDLLASRIIEIKEVKGRRRHEKRGRRRKGSIRKNIINKKGKYVIITRKLRKYAKELKRKGKIDNEKYKEVRKKIKSRHFRDSSHLINYLGGK